MTDIKVLDSSFTDKGTLASPVDLSPEMIKEATVHQIVKATLASRRQGTASTKNRSEVRGGGAKPFKQKGTGRARQGSTRSPLQVGGGTTFGPTPRDYTQKVNKKIALKAIHSIIADKFQAGKLTVLESFNSSGKTNELYKDLNGRGLLPALIVTDQEDDLALRAAKNLQWGKGVPVKGFSVYEAVRYENLVIEKAALEKLLNRLV
jgi:large subunit ribosomal protein L4